MFLRTALYISLSLIAGCASASANDSTAELATGGLIFTKSEHIEMQSEDLFISTKEIRVRYHFYNNSDNDIVTQVAFPMPDISYGMDDFNIAIPTTDPQNILGFKTTVNGRPVEMRVEQKSFIEGVDRTEILRGLDVPNDRAYGHTFQRRVRAMGIRDRPISPASPWQNGIAERLIGTLRRECLDKMVICGEAHLRRILSAYAAYYNQARTHLALQKDAPLHRAVQRSGAIVAIPILAGLHHQYVRI